MRRWRAFAALRKALCALIPMVLFGIPSIANAVVFSPETFTLSNGMQVVVVPNHRVPVVTHMVWYKVGSADEADGKSGIAHFLEHLMFKGTKKMAPGEFSQILARNGGRENAFTSFDYTAYYQVVAVDRLDMVMAMEADRMTGLVLTKEIVEPERQVILEERRQRTDNKPSALLREHLNAAMFLNHPYRRPIIGWEREIRGLSVDDILGFYRQWYAPNNAVLVVAGDMTAEKLRPLAEKHYGKIPAVPRTPRMRPQEPPQRAERRITLRDKRVRQPTWSVSFLAPSHRSGATQHADALETLDAILGDGATSRLYRSLVVEKKIAVSAGTAYSPGGRGPTTFAFFASPKPGVSMDTLEKAVRAEINHLLKNGVSAGETDRAKSRMLDDAIYARDSFRTGAQVLGRALAVGRTVADVESWPDRISAVTVEQINAAARAIFRMNRSVTSQLLPEEAG
jgi:zinc protease